MKILTLKIKPLEPLIFRQAGEFDPSARGVYSYASSSPIPRPSTIAGMLITNLLHSTKHVANTINSWKELLGFYRKVLDELGIYAIRGPYFYDTRRDIVYVPLSLSGGVKLVDYDQACYYLLREYRDLLSIIVEEKADPTYLQLLKYVEEELSRRYGLEVKEIWRTGIKLRSRLGGEASKTVEEGYLYTAKFIAYPESVEVRAKLIVSEKSPLKELSRVAKLGGEHRMAEIMISSETDGVDEVLSYSDLPESFYVLLLSPMPLKNTVKVKYIGSRDIIGLGFSIARSRRKPIYGALLKGSIIHIESSKFNLHDLLVLGLHKALRINDEELDVLARTGYSSFMPLIAE